MRRLAAVTFAAVLTLTAACGTSRSDVADRPSDAVVRTTDADSVTTTSSTTNSTSTTTDPAGATTTARAATPSTPLPVTAEELPRSGAGSFERATGVDFDVEGEPLILFSIAVEDGTGVDLDELTRFVLATLGDERSWTGRGAGFRLVDDGGLFTLAVATPDTVDELCTPLRTNGRFSCARNGWIALNLVRWMTATEEWPSDLDTYRRYLVNHEVGHYILGPEHPGCPGEGMPAPIMMQQTKGLDGCEPNGWVDPG